MKQHNCKTGRTDVKIVKDGQSINIIRSDNETFSDRLVVNIRFCPFCGVDLTQIKG